MKMKKASRKVLAMMAVTALMSGVSVVGAANLTFNNVNTQDGSTYNVQVEGQQLADALKDTSVDQAIQNAADQASNANVAANNAMNMGYDNQAAIADNKLAIDAVAEQAGNANMAANEAMNMGYDNQEAIKAVAEQAGNATMNANTALNMGYDNQAAIADNKLAIDAVAEQAGNATMNANTALNMGYDNQAAISDLQETTTAQGTAIDNMDGRLTAQESMMGDVRGEVAHLGTSVDNNTTAIKNNTAAINTVNTIVGDGVLSNTNASNLTEAVNQNYAQINNNTQAISALDNRVDDLGGEIDQVGAISAALAGLHPLDYDGTGSKFQLSAAMGSYDSSQAAAIGAFYHFNRDVMISLGGATSFDGDHKTAGNLGVTFRIGEGASGKAVSDDVMARLEAMDQKIAALEQENKDLKNVLGAIDTSLSKEFPDVPANHWAYEAVSKLAGNDIVAGYPDGEFHGDRTMTRYEMAEIIYKAMNKGVQVDQKLVNEFKPEMEQVAANERA